MAVLDIANNGYLQDKIVVELIEILKDGELADGSTHEEDIVNKVCEAYIDLYDRKGFTSPWTGYLAKLDDKIIGSCGFKSKPRNNRVEIAYYTFPGWEGQGLGTEMTGQLLELAHNTAPLVLVTARTLPETNASTTILEKLGFVCEGDVFDPDDGLVWEWAAKTKPRAGW